ncbi:hypothetical protein L1987_53532 [Smallanthus sonchifolius]|uniref:Uncharacterized protein n=1 Tax=Smallanthus sonchifolius TaxID=185202 RepID=A0ACB9EW68_9ASTR|nr:hypothetical protein L1987_53532 [Smallanthus sonchifolius]
MRFLYQSISTDGITTDERGRYAEFGCKTLIEDGFEKPGLIALFDVDDALTAPRKVMDMEHERILHSQLSFSNRYININSVTFLMP